LHLISLRSEDERGERIELVSVSKGSGAPVILIHGFFFDTYIWNRNIDALAEKFTVYALDLWGFGYSSREPLDYGYPLYTRQLDLFLDALGIQSASMIGQSLGGGIITDYTVSNRSRVSRVVLVDAAGMPNPMSIMGRISSLPGIGEVMYALRGDFTRRLTLANTFIHNKEIITDDFFENATQFHKIENSNDVMLIITRRDFSGTLLPKIEKLADMDVPTLIIWGREDRVIPLPTGRKMHEILNSARFRLIDHAGHCPNIDQPDEFNGLVLDFMSSAS
jgi:pimeloyl-ACP methyl ester carboxylesterase